jgi:pSer/pThr/pTyr-binding forkhead associated (FHA) protein
MSAQVKLTVIEGLSPIKEYVFTARTLCTVGRASDCYLQLPNDELHWTVSRHHCVLEIDPPNVLVRDLGSRNGTYVNGKILGVPDDGTPAPGAVLVVPELQLHPGDEVQLGNTILQIAPSAPDDSSAAGPGAAEKLEDSFAGRVGTTIYKRKS